MPIVLASTSPRRRELLENAGVLFEMVASPAEELHDGSLRPEDLCEHNAALKARPVANMRPDAQVIGADTLVFIDDEPLGKPKDMDEARGMLRKLSGRDHHVCTGVCVIHPDGAEDCFHGDTIVKFRELSDEDIEAYFDLVNPLDKAGAYGIQEHGDRIVEGIEGEFDNVMGLPVSMVLAALGVKS